MPKSKHRKKHKERVASFKRRQTKKKNDEYKKLSEQFTQQFEQASKVELDNTKENELEGDVR